MRKKYDNCFSSLTQCITGFTTINEKIKIELIRIFDGEEKKLEKQNNELFKKILINDLENKESKEINNEDENYNEDEDKLLFIIKNSLLFKIFCIKYLNLRNKEVFKIEDLQKMKFYFRKFLDKNEINLSESKLYDNNDIVMKDKDKLFESYRNNKFHNKLILFKIILLNYKIIFYLNDYPYYEIYSK